MKKILKNQAGFNVIGIIIAVVVVIVLAIFFVLLETKEEPIKIGAIISLSGPASNLVDVRDGMNSAADEVNSRGGINGRKIELIIADSKTKLQESKEAFNRIEATHHPIIYISTLSYVSTALSPLAEKNKVALIGLVVGKVNYEINYGKPFNHQSANGYDCVKILAGLLEDKEVSRESVRNLLEQGFTYPGVLGYLDVKPGEHDIVYSLYPARILNGKINYLR